MQAAASRIHGYVLGLIDGRRSIRDIARLLEEQWLMNRAEAEATVRQFLDIERAFQFLRDRNPAAAPEAVMAIQSAVDHLVMHPPVGRRLQGELRELVISYGRTGYIALYRFVVARDEVRILALRHQRAIGLLQ